MDPDKRNQIIANSIFAVLLIVPLVIGLSLYSRPDPPQPPAPAPIIYNPPQARPIQALQDRVYISGNAYDSVTNQPLSGDYISITEQGQPQGQENLAYVNTDGYFSSPVATATENITITFPKYQPKDVSIGPNIPGNSSIQSVGKIFLDPLDQKWSTYTDSHLKFSISYPNNLYLNPGFMNTPTGTSTDLVYVTIAASPSQNGTSIIQLYNSPDIYHHNTLDEYAKSYNPNDSSEQSRTKLVINGKPAIQILSNNGMVTTLMMRDSDHMVFNWSLTDPSGQYKKLYQQILEKFKF